MENLNMTTAEIYNLADALTVQNVLNIVAWWEDTKETKSIETYNSLVRLGDSMQLACATVIAEKINDKGELDYLEKLMNYNVIK